MTDIQPFSADSVMAGLTGFQRNTVEHIIRRFYGEDSSHRFLVADETGLGKTIVARGVIARTIEELQYDDSVDRIDIVYVCSNTDLAHQNLRKLNVTGDEHHGIASRLTLLAKHSKHFTPNGGSKFTKPVNLVSFTPGTSFEKGWRSGKAEERAMLYLLLEQAAGLKGRRAHAACKVLQGTVSTPEKFARAVTDLRSALTGGIDPIVSGAFLGAVVGGAPESLLDRFNGLIDLHLGNGSPPAGTWELKWRLVGELRATLAEKSIDLLTPDLVILDEFQRFRDLLRKDTEAGELAHHLYEYSGAKTLLLSATPFKPFTYAEEAQAGDSHHRDFMEVVRFLANGNPTDPADGIAAALGEYRKAIVTGRGDAQLTTDVREQLLQVMTRTERPRALGTAMSTESVSRMGSPPEEDVLGFVALKMLAREVGAPFSVEYWKSAPYFVNFMDGYKIADKVREVLEDPLRAEGVHALLSRTQRLDMEVMRTYQQIDMGNARLRLLESQTVTNGWWKLLWVPPSLPYLSPGGPYAEDFAAHMTKRLVFSSWTATPTAVASLLSYEADRLAAGDVFDGKSPDDRDKERRSRRSRLSYRMDQERDRPATMATLALFWPMPGLAGLADPLAFRQGAQSEFDSNALHADVMDRLASGSANPGETLDPTGFASHWFEAFRRGDSVPNGLAIPQILAALSGTVDEEDADHDTSQAGGQKDQDVLTRHVSEALEAHGSTQDREVPADVLDSLASLAAHSPANIAYRALQRISHDQDAVTPVGLWSAGALLASALRALFSRPETTLLLDQLLPDTVYWRAILQYCAWGNLQATLDEYVHHLFVSQGAPVLDDAGLLELARTAAAAIGLRPARYEVFDPDAPQARATVSARFALRYGGRRQEQESARQPQVRESFNSPFWPFVLATTSVGQEGIDFHWWCHAVLHWNTPASPIDFEQREGRIDRYDGHAVRRNIAQRHGDAILTSGELNPWQYAYELAADEVGNLGEFAPHWVYPGDSRIQRHLVPFNLSVDEARLANIKRDVALYRLTFGQPRQEDMLELLKLRYSESDPAALDGMRLNLSAPAYGTSQAGGRQNRVANEPIVPSSHLAGQLALGVGDSDAADVR